MPNGENDLNKDIVQVSSFEQLWGQVEAKYPAINNSVSNEIVKINEDNNTSEIISFGINMNRFPILFFDVYAGDYSEKCWIFTVGYLCDGEQMILLDNRRKTADSCRFIDKDDRVFDNYIALQGPKPDDLDGYQFHQLALFPWQVSLQGMSTMILKDGDTFSIDEPIE